MRSLVLIAALLLAVPTAAQAAEGDIIVQRMPGLDAAERAELRADAGVELVKMLPIERTELVSADDPAQALAELRADDDVAFAEPDREVQLTRVFDDPGFSQLWALQNVGQTIEGQDGIAGDDIDAVSAWDKSQGLGATVAVVDTGIRADHVDLADQIAANPAELAGQPGVDDDHNGYVDDIHGWDWVQDDNDPEDANGHGTHVSGTIAAAAQNDEGVVGVAPQAKVLPLRVLNAGGSGWSSDIAAAFAYAGDLGVRIVNASLGGERSSAVQAAVAAHPNTLYVVSAGNAAANADTYPNAFPCALPEANLVCVGATDNQDELAGFSNVGARAVDLFAPGVDILSTYRSSPTAYAFLSGTSMASPHVAGAAALALGFRPFISTAVLRQALLGSVDVKPQLAGQAVTGGRLDANAALDALVSAVPTPEPTPTPEPPVAPPPPPPPVAEPTPAPTPAPVAQAPPSLTRLKVSGSLGGGKNKLRVAFRLSRGAWVNYTVKAKKSKASFRWKRLGRAGANTVVIRRKLPNGKTLKRGSYTLTVTVGPTAAASKRIQVR
jgi:subtilisin family serine protease